MATKENIKFKCKGPLCTKGVLAKGYCTAHYKQYNRNLPITILRLTLSNKDRLYYYIDKQGPNECWNWKGSTTSAGYGQFMISGERKFAHRLVYEYEYDIKLNTDQTIDHLCANKICCNPSHLDLVTGAVNVRRFHMYENLRKEIDRLRTLCLDNGINPGPKQI